MSQHQDPDHVAPPAVAAAPFSLDRAAPGAAAEYSFIDLQLPVNGTAGIAYGRLIEATAGDRIRCRDGRLLWYGDLLEGRANG